MLPSHRSRIARDDHMKCFAQFFRDRETAWVPRDTGVQMRPRSCAIRKKQYKAWTTDDAGPKSASGKCGAYSPLCGKAGRKE
jgi:hypothetical protein